MAKQKQLKIHLSWSLFFILASEQKLKMNREWVNTNWNL